MDASDSDLLFLYGTLRTGGGHESLLMGCRRVAGVEVQGTLYDLGSYPAVVLEGAGSVRGELWECPIETVAALDAYEGVAEGLFRRVRVTAGGQQCWIYVAGPRLERALTEERKVPDGQWRIPQGPGGDP